MKEIWKDIKYYEGFYKISNFGRVKSLKKNIILKPWKLKYYSQVRLSKNGGKQTFSVHRLVGQAFLGLNINNTKVFVCHKSEELDINGLLNNHVDNLWIGNSKKNMADMDKKGRRVINKTMLGKFGKLHHGSKKVNQYDLAGNLIKVWDSLMDIQRELGILHNNIIKVCKGRRKTAGGYIWNYF